MDSTMTINQDRTVDLEERPKRQDAGISTGGMPPGARLSKKNSFSSMYDRLKQNYGYQTLQQPSENDIDNGEVGRYETQSPYQPAERQMLPGGLPGGLGARQFPMMPGPMIPQQLSMYGQPREQDPDKPRIRVHITTEKRSDVHAPAAAVSSARGERSKRQLFGMVSLVSPMQSLKHHLISKNSNERDDNGKAKSNVPKSTTMENGTATSGKNKRSRRSIMDDLDDQVEVPFEAEHHPGVVYSNKQVNGNIEPGEKRELILRMQKRIVDEDDDADDDADSVPRQRRYISSIYNVGPEVPRATVHGAKAEKNPILQLLRAAAGSKTQKILGLNSKSFDIFPGPLPDEHPDVAENNLAKVTNEAPVVMNGRNTGYGVFTQPSQQQRVPMATRMHRHHGRHRHAQNMMQMQQLGQDQMLQPQQQQQQQYFPQQQRAGSPEQMFSPQGAGLLPQQGAGLMGRQQRMRQQQMQLQQQQLEAQQMQEQAMQQQAGVQEQPSMIPSEQQQPSMMQSPSRVVGPQQGASGQTMPDFLQQSLQGFNPQHMQAGVPGVQGMQQEMQPQQQEQQPMQGSMQQQAMFPQELQSMMEATSPQQMFGSGGSAVQQQQDELRRQEMRQMVAQSRSTQPMMPPQMMSQQQQQQPQAPQSDQQMFMPQQQPQPTGPEMAAQQQDRQFAQAQQQEAQQPENAMFEGETQQPSMQRFGRRNSMVLPGERLSQQDARRNMEAVQLMQQEEQAEEMRQQSELQIQNQRQHMEEMQNLRAAEELKQMAKDQELTAMKRNMRKMQTQLDYEQQASRIQSPQQRNELPVPQFALPRRRVSAPTYQQALQETSKEIRMAGLEPITMQDLRSLTSSTRNVDVRPMNRGSIVPRIISSSDQPAPVHIKAMPQSFHYDGVKQLRPPTQSPFDDYDDEKPEVHVHIQTERSKISKVGSDKKTSPPSRNDDVTPSLVSRITSTTSIRGVEKKNLIAQPTENPKPRPEQTADKKDAEPAKKSSVLNEVPDKKEAAKS